MVHMCTSRNFFQFAYVPVFQKQDLENYGSASYISVEETLKRCCAGCALDKGQKGQKPHEMSHSIMQELV